MPMKSPAIVMAATVLIITASLFAAFAGTDRSFFLPGPLSSAHSRFTEGCLACHAPWKGSSQELCLNCHARAMTADSHPASKLASPVTAKVPPELSRVTCVDCHREHRPSSAKGYTGPAELCRSCHPAQTLKGAHRDFSDSSCRTVACHSYHSNIKPAQYSAAFKHRLKSASQTVPKPAPLAGNRRITPEDVEKMKSDSFYKNNPVVSARYEIGAHFGTQATCRLCHINESGSGLKPGVTVCADCHERQVKTFLTGRHGSPDTVNGGLPAIGQAEKMGCGSCHDVHSLRLENAGNAACLECHTDTHALNHEKSGHNRYLTDPVFENKPMKGVDCAGCHMPRLAELDGHTDHNETLSSSSKERMALTVCSNCHGLRFALMAIYDGGTTLSNFTTAPSNVHRGIEYLDSLIGGVN
ncbi:MAG: cytochrome c3 family protein [Nitrospinae bacterium]|nr:cytochrome c3 family protein [Nitrospinota bacterium]